MVKNEKKRVNKLEKKVKKLKREEDKNRTLLERGLRETGMPGAASELLAKALGMGVDFGLGYLPVGGGAISAFGHSFNLWSTQHPKKRMLGNANPYHPKAGKPGTAFAMPAKRGPLTQKPTLGRQLFLAPKLRGESVGRSVPFNSGALMPRAFHESVPVGDYNNIEIHSITGRQYLSELPTSGTAGDLIASIILQADYGPLAGTKLQALMQMYQKLTWVQCSVVYVPYAAADEGGGLGMLGWLDPDETISDIPQTERTRAIFDLDNAECNNNFYRGAVFDLPLSGKSVYETLIPTDVESADSRWNAAGRFEAVLMATYGQSTPYETTPGVFFIEYDILGVQDNAYAGTPEAASGIMADARLFGHSANTYVRDFTGAKVRPTTLLSGSTDLWPCGGLQYEEDTYDPQRSGAVDGYTNATTTSWSKLCSARTLGMRRTNLDVNGSVYALPPGSYIIFLACAADGYNPGVPNVTTTSSHVTITPGSTGSAAFGSAGNMKTKDFLLVTNNRNGTFQFARTSSGTYAGTDYVMFQQAIFLQMPTGVLSAIDPSLWYKPEFSAALEAFKNTFKPSTDRPTLKEQFAQMSDRELSQYVKQLGLSDTYTD